MKRKPLHSSSSGWNLTRRGFLASTGTAPWWVRRAGLVTGGPGGNPSPEETSCRELLDFSPARWIWYPFGRFLHNSFVLLRREFELPAPPRAARGWILADSRYLLRVNGRRVQWGPAPCDPRWLEADPLDLAPYLVAGKNVLATECLYYGSGDGTSPMGKPGFICRLKIECTDGTTLLLVSDRSWQACLGTAWKLGQYKRDYLRSLQEEFDARRYPYGWDRPGYYTGSDWLPAMELDCPADRPAVCAANREYALDFRGDAESAGLYRREIPFMVETLVEARLRRVQRVRWRRPVEEFFAVRPPEAYTARSEPIDVAATDTAWEAELSLQEGLALTFELPEQMVGRPFVRLEAPEGTVMELLVADAHDPNGPPLLNLDLNAWTRFTCREGVNEFETFDYESARWMQLHLHGAAGRARVSTVGLRRRRYPWPQEPDVVCDDERVMRAIRAAVNTLANSAQESVVDCMGRERQQYSGDVGHQLHALHWACGETRLPARYVRTFNQGITLEGYFLDCWPAYDRLARIAQRHLQLTRWGPILDHGIGHVFDVYHTYRFGGRLEVLREVFPRLERFVRYLADLRRDDDLLPVEDLGVPSVWIDHTGYPRQRHKQCAFNLYAAAMFNEIFPALAEAAEREPLAEWSRLVAKELETATRRRFWDPRRSLFVNNLPWEEEEQGPRFCDRSLATAILYGSLPEEARSEAGKVLAEKPPELGLSYVPNTCWRYWALAELGRVDVILRELREIWAEMPSVVENNTISELWSPRRDSSDQWSHCGVVPLYLVYTSLVGVKVLESGCRRLELRPQPGDLERLEATVATALGPMPFRLTGPLGGRRLTVVPPEDCRLELVVDARESLPLEGAPDSRPGLRRYEVPPEGLRNFRLEYC